VNALIPICRLVKLLKLYNESGKVPVIEFGDQIFSGIVPFIELLFNRSDSNDPISPGMLPAKLFYTRRTESILLSEQLFPNHLHSFALKYRFSVSHSVSN